MSHEAWPDATKAQWAVDCRRWRGKVLDGAYCHWCDEWDGLPVDATCPEWPCGCFDAPIDP